MKVLCFTREEWLEKYSKVAYHAVFQEDPEGIKESLFDYAFSTVDEKECPIIYTTIKQMSETTIYIEHGGSFPDYRGSSLVKPAFQMMCDAWMENGAKTVTLATRYDNVAMQKLALHTGFLPYGMFTNEKGLFLQYALKSKEEKI